MPNAPHCQTHARRLTPTRAGCAVEYGALDEATQHFRELLRLNPNDNQGVRDSLICVLLERGCDEDAQTLWKRYGKDVSACWTWSAVLLAFRRSGGTGAAVGRALARARESNAFVADYLSERKPLPEHGFQFMRMGSEEGAIDYAEAAAGAWDATPGARKWLLGRT